MHAPAQTDWRIWIAGLLLLTSIAPFGAAEAAKDKVNCKGCVDTRDIGKKAVTRKHLRAGAVSLDKLAADVQTLSTLSCGEGQVPVRVAGSWSCGTPATPIGNDYSGYAQPFAAQGAPRNVIVLEQQNANGSKRYSARVRFLSSTFDVSVAGTPTQFDRIAMYAYVDVDAGGAITRIGNWIDAMNDPAYADYHIEQTQIDPSTLVATVVEDTERLQETCGNAAGGAMQVCLQKVVDSGDGSLVRFQKYDRQRVLIGPYTLNGLSFDDVRLESRGDLPTSLRLRAKGVGTVLNGNRAVIYYRIDGESAGSLAGTPFEPGVGALEGLFF